jgi:hypothetical protein
MELSTGGTIVAGAFQGIGNALLGTPAAAPVSAVAAQERSIDTKTIMVYGAVALAAIVGIVLLVK